MGEEAWESSLAPERKRADRRNDDVLKIKFYLHKNLRLGKKKCRDALSGLWKGHCMPLADFLAHLARRFPDGATILSAEIALFGFGHPAGLIETVSYEADDNEDNPDDGVEADESIPSLQLVAA